jgi:hypothetical protein
MSIVAERTEMHDSLSGATTNLLRMARSECRGALAFVALSLDDNLFTTAAYPTVSDDDLFGEEEVEEVVHQAWADPEFGQAGVFVRASRLKSRRLTRPKRFVVAIVPLGDGPGGRPWGMLGVIDPEGGGFEAPQLDLLDQIAQRLAGHLRARQEVRETVAASTATSNGPVPPISWPTDEPAAPVDELAVPLDEPVQEDEVWWSVEPVRAPARPAEPAPTQPAESAPAPARPAEPAEPGVRRGPLFDRPGSPLWAAATQLGQLGVRRSPGTEPPRTVLADLVRSGPVDPEHGRPEADWSEPQRLDPQRPEAQRPIEAEWPAAPERQGAPERPAEPELLSAFLSASPVDGLMGLAAFVGRAGRMLGAGAVAGGGSLAVVVLEIVGSGPLDEPTVASAAAALRRELRFDDPVAQLAPAVFAAAVPLVPGGSDGPAVEGRLAAALRSASVGRGGDVRAAHVVSGPAERADADELLRSAMAMLREG